MDEFHLPDGRRLFCVVLFGFHLGLALKEGMTKSHLIKVAKQEIQEWKDIPKGVVMAILWAYVERVTNGEPIEKTYFKPRTQVVDYEI